MTKIQLYIIYSQIVFNSLIWNRFISWTGSLYSSVQKCIICWTLGALSVYLRIYRHQSHTYVEMRRNHQTNHPTQTKQQTLANQSDIGQVFSDIFQFF